MRPEVHSDNKQDGDAAKAVQRNPSFALQRRSMRI
jgi:hypothetical protein